jgi:GR25 family glycosyltransferase involved in LPS biosynthesis
MCLLGALMVVSFNAQKLLQGPRYIQGLYDYYLPEGEDASSASTSEVFGRVVEDEHLMHPTNHHSLPPIYWINLDISASRRRAMREMFLSLGISDTVRVSAFDINATLELWNDDRLIFYPNVTLEARDGRPSNKKHVENIYEYQEAACLMSHIKAIQRAYKDGHSQVLILEDDALMTHNFRNQWKPYVDQAPLGWKILQFATNNPNVVRQGVNLVDPFVTWQPYHWSTRAYLINRAGMQTIMDKFHSKSPTGQDIWRIDEAPMVVADEVIYFMTGEAYTSTGLWVDSQNFGSTIQSNNAHSNLSSLIGDPTSTGGLHRNHYMLSKRKDPRRESLLVLRRVVVKDLESLTMDSTRQSCAH